MVVNSEKFTNQAWQTGGAIANAFVQTRITDKKK